MSKYSISRSLVCLAWNCRTHRTLCAVDTLFGRLRVRCFTATAEPVRVRHALSITRPYVHSTSQRLILDQSPPQKWSSTCLCLLRTQAPTLLCRQRSVWTIPRKRLLAPQARQCAPSRCRRISTCNPVSFMFYFMTLAFGWNAAWVLSLVNVERLG